MAVSPLIARSQYNRVQYQSGVLSLAPAPIVTTFPGDTSQWQQSGAAWTVVDNDKLRMNNTSAANNFLNLIYPLQQATAQTVTMRLRAAGSGIATGLGIGFGMQAILTDFGGLGGVTLANVTLAFPAGTWPEAELELDATPVGLADPSTPLTLSEVADASSTLAATPYYVDFALTNPNGATTPGSSEASITPSAANAYDIQFSVDLSNTNGTIGIILGVGTASGGEAQYAAISSAGAVTYVGTNAAGVSASVAGTTLTVTIAAPPSDTSTAMPVSNTATAVPAYYLYAYIFARFGVGELTIRDAEVFESGGAAARSGFWRSETIDAFRAAGLPMQSSTLGLEQIGFYYGDPSNVDNRDSVTHSVDALSQFARVVMNEPALLTTARQQAVANALIAAGVKLYGYVNLGAGEVAYNGCIPPISAVTAALDRIAAFGYAGAFFDAAGHYPVSTDYLNYIKSYSAGKSPALEVFANAHPQDCLGSTVNTATLSPPTGTPALAAAAGSTSLAAGTYTFGFTSNVYDGETTIGPTAQVTITAGQQIDVAALTGFAAGTQEIGLYMSEAAGSSTLRRVLYYDGAATSITALPSGSAPTPPAANTAYVVNPYGVASTLGAGDWTLWESFYSRDDNQYAGVPEGGFQNVLVDYVAAAPLAHAQGVKLAALAYSFTSTPLGDSSDQRNAYLLAAMLGFDGLCYTNSTSNNLLQWDVLAAPAIGSALATPVSMAMAQVSPLEWYAQTDEGVVWFQATDSPATRSSGYFAVGTAPPPIEIAAPAVASSVGRSTTLQEGSADRTAWSTYDPQSPLRYTRSTVTLES